MTHREALANAGPNVSRGECDGFLRRVTRSQGDRRRICMTCGFKLFFDREGVVWAETQPLAPLSRESRS